MPSTSFNQFLRHHRSAGFIITLFLFSGCSGDPVATALGRARAAPDPAMSLRIIQEATAAYWAACNGLFKAFCRTPPALLEAETSYFEAATRAANGTALRDLFLRKSVIWRPLQDEVATDLISRAKTSADPDTLVAAANLVGNNQFGIVDRRQQLIFLQKAWAVGDKTAAGTIGHFFARSNDYENAYLWSLRCNDGCNREEGLEDDGTTRIELVELEKHLKPNQIASLQQMALH